MADSWVMLCCWGHNVSVPEAPGAAKCHVSTTPCGVLLLHSWQEDSHGESALRTRQVAIVCSQLAQILRNISERPRCDSPAKPLAC
jgi:hypothetical protein